MIDVADARSVHTDGWLLRTLVKVGVREHDAKLLLATPSLRISWAIAGTAAIGFSAWAARTGDARATGVFLLVAPLLPLGAVAAAYGAWVDPMFEVTQPAPLSSFRLLLLRSAAVLTLAAVIVAGAAVLLPGPDWTMLSWILPSLALALACLALSTFVPIHRAAALVVVAWFATIFATEIRSTERFAAFRGTGQVAFFALVVGSSAVLAWRRDRIEREGRAERRRLIDVAEAERRRIERDIHDGAQQQLVAISVKLGLARTFVSRDPARAETLLAELQGDAQDALDSLREMTRGTYPPVLADEGLAAAIRSKGRKAPVFVEVAADGVGRFPREIEAAVYFCCLEAIQNAAKYAGAGSVSVSLRCVGGELSFTVTDGGGGFDMDTAKRGVGLRSMTERIETLGGTLEIRSAPGAGTTVVGRVPGRLRTGFGS